MTDLYHLSSYHYELPEELIAKRPLDKRDACKLLLLDRKKESIEHAHFYDLPDILDSSFHLALNNSKVFPARLFAKKATGAKIEILLLQEMEKRNYWKALIKPAKKVPLGTLLKVSNSLAVKVIDKDLQQFIVELQGESPFEAILQEGSIPLPPYMKREADASDKEDYQTVFAGSFGSVAAPTAGLHFTNDLLHTLYKKNIFQNQLTLHVGLGTFLPVKTENILEHKMHQEHLWIGEEAADALNQSKKNGKKILPVGTTALRALETAYCPIKGLQTGNFTSELFIYPGYQFKFSDSLITNFHLPSSTLLMLVSAFAGRELVFEAYRKAIENRYRFFSYGDAMLIL